MPESMEKVVDKEITLCTAWIILARAMCIVDHKALPIEERTAVKFAKGALNFSDEEIVDSKSAADLFSLIDAIECAKSEHDSMKRDLLYGLVVVAASDDEYRDEELMLLASLAVEFGIDNETFKNLCHKGNVLREFL